MSEARISRFAATASQAFAGRQAPLNQRPAAGQPKTWSERERAMPWPPELLLCFALRMGSHGLCVSRALMMCDRRYALQQLADAHNLADETLRSMAVELFRCMEVGQSSHAH